MTLKQAKELVRSRLSDQRYEHTLNVKKMAVKLAKRYGADEEQAALAVLAVISGVVVLGQLDGHFSHVQGVLVALVTQAAAHKLLCLFEVHWLILPFCRVSPGG